jgi:TatD DNase family protein
MHKMLIDSHSHLNLGDYDDDLEGVKQSMTENGVEAAIVVGIDLATSRKAISLSNEWRLPTAGIHPQSDNFNDTEAEWQELEKLLEEKKLVAVGETGIDFYHDRVPPEVQKKRFARHLAYGRERDLAVIVHCRDADGSREAAQTTMDIIEQEGKGTRGVLHCYAGDLPLGQFALDRGWAVSLAGNLTFKNAQDLRQAVGQLKGERFLVETDCPFLTPAPFRGRKNSPAMVLHTARVLGEIRGWDFDETVQKTRQSTIELFDLSLDKGETE